MPCIFAETDRWIFAASTITDGLMNVPLHPGEADGEEFLRNTESVFKPLLPTVRSFQTACLCHRSTIVDVSRSTSSQFYDDTDGLMVDAPGIALRVTGADCPPVMVVDEVQGRMALVHAGRKGTRINIAGQAAERMKAAGSEAGQLKAIIGPGVCAAHYQMPPDILADFSQYPDAINGAELDLPRIIRTQLTDAGVVPGNIRDIRECTFEMREKWFSYRRDTHDGLKFDRPRVQAFVAMLK